MALEYTYSYVPWEYRIKCSICIILFFVFCLMSFRTGMLSQSQNERVSNYNF